MKYKKYGLLSGLFTRAEDLIRKYERSQELAVKVYDKSATTQEENEYYTTCNVTRQQIKDVLKMVRQVSLEVERDL